MVTVAAILDFRSEQNFVILDLQVTQSHYKVLNKLVFHFRRSAKKISKIGHGGHLGFPIGTFS